MNSLNGMLTENQKKRIFLKNTRDSYGLKQLNSRLGQQRRVKLAPINKKKLSKKARIAAREKMASKIVGHGQIKFGQPTIFEDVNNGTKTKKTKKSELLENTMKNIMDLTKN